MNGLEKIIPMENKKKIISRPIRTTRGSPIVESTSKRAYTHNSSLGQPANSVQLILPNDRLPLGIDFKINGVRSPRGLRFRGNGERTRDVKAEGCSDEGTMERNQRSNNYYPATSSPVVLIIIPRRETMAGRSRPRRTDKLLIFPTMPPN